MFPALLALAAPLAAATFLTKLPPDFAKSPARWAYYSYHDSEFAVLPGQFNRSTFVAPWGAITTDEELTKTNDYLNTTDFIAYDERFFDFIGPDATIKRLHKLPFQTHEAACYNPHSKQLFFTQWGPPGGIDGGVHSWQYLLDTETNKLHNITTDPPTVNAHGCVFYNGAMYVATDGDLMRSSAELVKIDPKTFKKTVLLNNFYQQPFIGFNDVEIDPYGNFWLTDSWAGWERGIVEFTPPTNPAVYFVNATTMRPRVVDVLTGNGNTNGVAYRKLEDGSGVLYVSNTGASQSKPVVFLDPDGPRNMISYNVQPNGATPNGGVLFSNPIEYFWDGVRVSRNGWIFGGAGQGVDVMDPATGEAIGTIRVGGGQNVAVNFAFGEHEMWIVGKGGVWHVSGIKERLDREW